MQTCTCGCNQILSQRTIRRHLSGQTKPRLITARAAAAKAMHTTQQSIASGPRLSPSTGKKSRSSRHHHNLEVASLTAGPLPGPSTNLNVAPPVAAAERAPSPMEDIGCDENSQPVPSLDPEAIIERMRDSYRPSVWMGSGGKDLTASDDEIGSEVTEVSDSEHGGSDEGIDYDDKGGRDDELEDNSETERSDLNMLEEGFERDVVASGEYLLPSSVFRANHTSQLIIVLSWQFK